MIGVRPGRVGNVHTGREERALSVGSVNIPGDSMLMSSNFGISIIRYRERRPRMGTKEDFKMLFHAKVPIPGLDSVFETV